MALENKFGIQNSANLAREEEQISKEKLLNCLGQACLNASKLESSLPLSEALENIDKMPQSIFASSSRSMWK